MLWSLVFLGFVLIITGLRLLFDNAAARSDVVAAFGLAALGGLMIHIGNN